MANHLSITNPLYLAKNDPIEIKSRITSLANLTDITYPWIGMKFYSILEEIWYEVRTLKQGYLDYSTGSLTDVRPAGSEFVNFEIVPNLYIDTYHDDTLGQDGVGIDSILKTGEEDNYDIYTVTLTDTRTYEIRVRQGVDGISPSIGPNGNWWFGGSDTGVKAESTDGQDGRGITSITLVSTVGLIKTYEILFTDGGTFRFEVKDGRDGEDAEDGIGIISTTKQSTTENIDTYNINYTNGSVDTFTVTNAKQVEFFRSGNDVSWRYVGELASYSVLNTIELGTATMTFAQRIVLTGVIDGAKVFQTDGAKGEYQYVSGKWYFIGNKLAKQINAQYYTLQEADIGYLLEFTLDIPGVEVEVTIPSSVFADGHIIDIIQGGVSKVKFLNGSGMVAEIDSLYPNRRTYNKIAEAKIRFKSASSATVTGGLE